tara:strand:+ start:608 stop:1099 length:492 start_codon:yes stop_codon:yes gene_type:complete
MAANMMVCSKMERNGDKVLINGLIAVFILVLGLTIISKEKENTTGQMAESIKVPGKKISLMVRVSITGLMAEDMTENTKTTKSMGLELTTGQMEKLMKAIGSMVSNTVKLSSPILKVEVNSVYGKTEKELNGLITKTQCIQKMILKDLTHDNPTLGDRRVKMM